MNIEKNKNKNKPVSCPQIIGNWNPASLEIDKAAWLLLQDTGIAPMQKKVWEYERKWLKKMKSFQGEKEWDTTRENNFQDNEATSLKTQPSFPHDKPESETYVI